MRAQPAQTPALTCVPAACRPNSRAQTRFWEPFTLRALNLAGLKQGMRVLAASVGPDNLASLASHIVGPTGHVTAVDLSAEATALATGAAHASDPTNAPHTRPGALQAAPGAPFDALIGRNTLMWFPDPAVMLRRLLALVRPGGVAAFLELDLQGATSEPRCDLFETTLDWMRQAHRRAGVDTRAGLRLATIFEEAGLPFPALLHGAQAERGPASPVYRHLAELTRAALPLIVSTRVATASKVEIDTLEDRLRAEALAFGATLVPPPLIGAWVRAPATSATSV